MIAHIGVIVRNYKKSKAFYAKSLTPLSYKLNIDYTKHRAAGYMAGGQTDFWISEQKRVTPTHVAFLAKNKRVVNAFYKAAIKAGGKDNGAPGYRAHYSPSYYAAFVSDLDGNNIEAVWFDPKSKK